MHACNCVRALTSKMAATTETSKIQKGCCSFRKNMTYHTLHYVVYIYMISIVLATNISLYRCTLCTGKSAHLATNLISKPMIWMRSHGLRQLVNDKSVASCQQTCCKLIVKIVKTCYPQACCRLFQQV